MYKEEREGPCDCITISVVQSRPVQQHVSVGSLWQQSGFYSKWEEQSLDDLRTLKCDDHIYSVLKIFYFASLNCISLRIVPLILESHFSLNP